MSDDRTLPLGVILMEELALTLQKSRLEFESLVLTYRDLLM